jgi:hypothetical protein
MDDDAADATPASSVTNFEWLYAGEAAVDGATTPLASLKGRRKPDAKSPFKRGRPASHTHANAAAAMTSATALAPSYAQPFVTGLAGAQTGVNAHRVTASLAVFPVHRGLDPEKGELTSSLLQPVRLTDSAADAVAATTDLIPSHRTCHALLSARWRSRAAVYDPSYLLPAMLALITAGRLQPRRFAACGALPYAIACLASSHTDVRKAAYAVLGAYMQALEASKDNTVAFREKPQVR